MTELNDEENKQTDIEDIELSLKKRELDLKKEEISLREKEFKEKGKINSTIIIGISVAIIGLFGSMISSSIQGRNQLEIEKTRLNSDLILKAIDEKDHEKSKENLIFLLEIGLIEDESNKLKKILNDPDEEIKIPSNDLTRVNIIYEHSKEYMTGRIFEDGGIPIKNAEINFINFTGIELTGVTDNNGEFQLKKPKGFIGTGRMRVKTKEGNSLKHFDFRITEPK